MHNIRGDLTDISANKEALIQVITHLREANEAVERAVSPHIILQIGQSGLRFRKNELAGLILQSASVLAPSKHTQRHLHKTTTVLVLADISDTSVRSPWKKILFVFLDTMLLKRPKNRKKITIFRVT